MQKILYSVLLVLSSFTARAENFETVPYQRLQQKSVHNAYQRNESLIEQLEIHRLRSLELDVFPSKKGQAAPARDWYVYHSPLDSKSSVDLLSDGLAVLRDFHDKNPNHEVLTLWMDIKAPFRADGHLPEDLDQRFRQSLGSMLWSPADFLQRCPQAFSLQQSVQIEACPWPSMEELRGKIMIVLTSDPILTYAADGNASRDRVAFIAPQINKPSAVDEFPWVIFFNMEKSVAMRGDLPRALHERRLIGRTWDVNDAKSWRTLTSLPIQHLATDKVNTQKDPWATTIGSDGQVFQVIAPTPNKSVGSSVKDY